MEKIKRTRPSKSVTFTLNPKNPVEQALIKILEEKRSLRTSSHRHAYGTELIRELVLIGTEIIEQRFPGQLSLPKEGNIGDSSDISLRSSKMESKHVLLTSPHSGQDICAMAGTIPLD